MREMQRLYSIESDHKMVRFIDAENLKILTSEDAEIFNPDHENVGKFIV